jgi:4-hydroxybenzoate polyprenyltransferase
LAGAGIIGYGCVTNRNADIDIDRDVDGEREEEEKSTGNNCNDLCD